MTDTSVDIASKGIAGRAVFVDWYAWALEQGKDVDVTTPYAVPFSEILEALHRQGLRTTDFSKGDILIIRFGYLRQYADMGDDKRARLNEHYKNHKPDNIGIEPSKEFLQFLWDTQIAAVAGDTRSFEVWPCSQLDWHLHEWLLAGWGMPIGELFDLEELAKICASTGRYTFFLSSAPMNVRDRRLYYMTLANGRICRLLVPWLALRMHLHSSENRSCWLLIETRNDCIRSTANQ